MSSQILLITYALGIFVLATTFFIDIEAVTSKDIENAPRNLNFHTMAMPAETLLQGARQAERLEGSSRQEEPQANGNEYGSFIGRSRAGANRLRRLRQKNKSKAVMLTAQKNDAINNAIKTLLAWQNVKLNIEQ